MRLLGRALAPLFALCFLVLPFFCPAQGAEDSLVPLEVFVGDEAVLTYMEYNVPSGLFSASIAAGSRAVEIPHELLPPDSSEVSVRGARLIFLPERGDAALCEITFVPWKTGEVVIPSFAFDEEGSARSRPQAVVVLSLVERRGVSALSANRPPLLPPGTVYLAYAFVLCLAASLFFIAFAARKILRRAKAPRRIPAKKTRREIARRLRRLKRRIGEESALWYGELSAVARLFFYRMTGERKFLAATARDIERFLEAAGCGEEGGESAKKLACALREIESARFSGKPLAAKDGSLERGYIEAIEGFVFFACAAPEVFFALEKGGGEGDEGKADTAARGKGGRGHAVV